MNKKLTREEAIELHREMWQDMQTELGDDPSYCEEGHCDFPIQGSGYPYDAPCFGYETEDDESKWIPVTEEPKKSGKYLVTAVISFIPGHVDDPNTYEAVTMATYLADAKGSNKWWGYNVEKVLAWMPLPEPYKGGAEREAEEKE